MAVLNLTPDSFSDGGLWLDPERAVDHAHAMLEAGADLLDLGAESTRPGGGVYGEGAATVPPEEEKERLLPVLRALRRATEAPLSVDTRKGAVAEAALAEGADLINDISALGDPVLGRAVAAAGCPLVLMHSRGEISSMQREIAFDDLLQEIGDELASAKARARAAGVDEDQIVLDPGIGFGKTYRQNLEILHHLPRFHAIGSPLLVGASRKSFLGHLTGRPAAERQPESLAAAAWAAAGGAALLRVHDVDETVRFLTAWQAIAEPTEASC